MRHSNDYDIVLFLTFTGILVFSRLPTVHNTSSETTFFHLFAVDVQDAFVEWKSRTAQVRVTGGTLSRLRHCEHKGNVTSTPFVEKTK